MKFTDFKIILEQLSSVSYVHLQGFGEPLLCEEFFQMLEYSHARSIRIGTVTNGTLLSSKNNEKILNSGIDYITISIDGAHAETFEKIRVGCNFGDVMQKVTDLLALRGKRKRPVIGFLFVCTNSNLAELPAVVQLGGSMGVDVVQAQRALSFDDVTIRTRLQNNDFLKRIKEWEAIVNKASGVARNAHISFYWVGGGRSLSSPEGIDWFNHEPQRCVKPYHSCYITADGYVTACCVNPDPERHNFGNILETSFADIWKGQAYKTMRKEFSKGSIPDYCLTCTVPLT